MTEEQVREIGAELSNGGRPPKVALRESSAGLPAGTVGTVVRLGDPTESEEFVVVRINKDELPFTPVELEPAPPRAKKSKPAVPAAPAPKPAPNPAQKAAPKSTQNAAASAAQRGSAATVSVPAGDGAAAAVAEPAPAADATPASAPAQSAAAGPATKPATRPTRPAAAETQTRPSARSEGGRRGAKRQVPKLTVQLHYDERGWTVEASRGARSVVKATPVRPAAALQVAELLDNEQVSQAIAEIAQAERDEAERRAAELRAQLAEVEAVLAGYQD